MTVQTSTSRLWDYTLRKLFNSVGMVLITAYSQTGPWKLGKTDFGLWLAENLLRLNIVSEVATNINTEGTFTEISDLISLRHWLHSSGSRKLYILDELQEHAYRRKAMTGKNVGIVQIFPQISKARARLIGIGQNLMKIDKDIMDDTWVHGVFIKKNRKIAQLVSHLLTKQYVFRTIPKTTVPFDPYEIAPFTQHPKPGVVFKEEQLQKIYDWATGKSYRELGFDHPMQFNRWIRRTMLELLTKLQNQK